MNYDDEAFNAYINYLKAQANGNVGTRKEKWEELLQNEIKAKEGEQQ